jgi:uncharacterized protein (TIGR02145 family)
MKITVILSILLSIFIISCSDDSGSSASQSSTEPAKEESPTDTLLSFASLGLDTCTQKIERKIEEAYDAQIDEICTPLADGYGESCSNKITSIDSSKKVHYICRNHEGYELSGKTEYDYKLYFRGWWWDKANDNDMETSDLECYKEGKIVSKKDDPSKQYVCDFDTSTHTFGVLRLADSSEIKIGTGCTYYTNGGYRIANDSKTYFYCKKEFDPNDIEERYYRHWIFATKKNLGSITDPRNGRPYKTLNLGKKTWMIENLSYEDTTKYPSMIGRNKVDTYGRLYTWSAIIDSVYWAHKGKTCGNLPSSAKICGLPDVVQGICPEGWHVPSITEWEEMVAWTKSYNVHFDTIGFFPSSKIQEYSFWSSTETSGDSSSIYEIDLIEPQHSTSFSLNKAKDSLLPVRCIKDD